MCHRENRKPSPTARPANSGTGIVMCYTDVTTHADGTATAFCNCGWTEEHPSHDAAAAATDAHHDAELAYS